MMSSGSGIKFYPDPLNRQMDRRIELELRGRDKSEVTELNLDNCRATAVNGLTEEFTNLETISMISVGLTSLKGLPALPSLQRLDLADNRLSGNLDQLLCCPNIQYLNLSNNKITTMEALEPLKKLKELRSLELYGNTVEDLDDFRKNCFESLPSLKYLDGFDVNDEEAESDNEILQEGDDGDEDDDDDGLDGSDNDDEEGVEDEEVGLDYLQSSTVMQDEDETEEYAPGEEEEEEEAGAARGVKRKHENGGGDEAEEKGEKAKREA